jgi:hypothetical protein
MNDAGAGDKLARGAVKATYLVSENLMTQKKWDDIFGDFDPEEFKKNGMPKVAGEKKETVRSHK